MAGIRGQSGFVEGGQQYQAILSQPIIKADRATLLLAAINSYIDNAKKVQLDEWLRQQGITLPTVASIGDYRTQLLPYRDRIPLALLPTPLVTSDEIRWFATLPWLQTPSSYMEVISLLLTMPIGEVIKHLSSKINYRDTVLEAPAMRPAQDDYDKYSELFRKKIFIEEGSFVCPFCGSHSYYQSTFQAAARDESFVVRLSCVACHRGWQV